MPLFEGDKFRLRNSGNSGKKIKRARGQLLDDVSHPPETDLDHPGPDIDPGQEQNYHWPEDRPGTVGLRFGFIVCPVDDPVNEMPVGNELRWPGQEGIITQGEAVLEDDGTVQIHVMVSLDGNPPEPRST